MLSRSAVHSNVFYRRFLAKPPGDPPPAWLCAAGMGISQPRNGLSREMTMRYACPRGLKDGLITVVGLPRCYGTGRPSRG